ncbi:hypothetical protein [Burkholderia cenocepacia]|uniref:hypothetical protein n=1 Tax=Burkholderia cenocepacia TaxID=95486 RepID=UPI002AB774AF|nr:hypothetical protein [Burkholderia cenocepacia]
MASDKRLLRNTLALTAAFPRFGSWSSKNVRWMRGLMFSGCLMASTVWADVGVNGGITDPVTPPQTIEQILTNLRELVDHGDLADVQFFANKLGVVMKGFPVQHLTIPSQGCVRLPTHEIGQYFNYIKIPYFIEPWNVSGTCNTYGYTKEFLSNGRVWVNTSIDIDVKKICITEDDIKKYIPESKITIERNRFIARYHNQDRSINAVDMTILSAPPTWTCIGGVNFYQNVKPEAEYP